MCLGLISFDNATSIQPCGRNYCLQQVGREYVTGRIKQSETEVEEKMARKERKGGRMRNFFICSQAVDFTDYLNYNLLRLRGHTLFINIKLKRPNY